MNNLKKITKGELEAFLRKHKLWLMNKPGGERANLREANLTEANLRGADLRGADLRGADLRWANLTEADLREANLRGADLRWADLRVADLRGADLREADLREANLREADLRWADLRVANLRWADLRVADLRGADLREADLREANLREANLRGADLRCPICCPEKGEFIGFKKASNYIVELKILDDAKRSSATSRKCRCSKALVLSITNLDGSDCGLTEVCSGYDSKFIYRIGEIVSVNDFCEDRWEECAPGIHFFITRQEAVEYIN